MNKIANQFTSIEQVADQYLNPSKSNKTQPEQGASFAEVLKEKQKAAVDSLAFIVNVPSRTVVTAMDQNESENNVFTNIDGAVIA